MDPRRAGSFVLIPGGVTHDFENRGEVRAGVLNFYAPGTFEEHMPEIARWWRENLRARGGTPACPGWETDWEPVSITGSPATA